MGRSFHWMDRAATMAALDALVSPGGAVALFDDKQPRTEENLWCRKLEERLTHFGKPKLLIIDELGYLVEKLSGESFVEFLRTRLFQPLGMNDTAFWVPEDTAQFPRLLPLFRLAS